MLGSGSCDFLRVRCSGALCPNGRTKYGASGDHKCFLPCLGSPGCLEALPTPILGHSPAQRISACVALVCTHAFVNLFFYGSCCDRVVDTLDGGVTQWRCGACSNGASRLCFSSVKALASHRRSKHGVKTRRAATPMHLANAQYAAQASKRGCHAWHTCRTQGDLAAATKF